ncbi:MAG: hypothetical protein QM742_11085 [Aquabacterium sp.]
MGHMIALQRRDGGSTRGYLADAGVCFYDIPPASSRTSTATTPITPS